MCCCNKQCSSVIVILNQFDAMKLAKKIPHAIIVDAIMDEVNKHPSKLVSLVNEAVKNNV